jgi:uncharacterized integral membrane protein
MPEKVVAKLITILVIFILLVIFAIQNFQEESQIQLFFWKIGNTPISVIIFVSILIGAIIAVCALFPYLMRLRRKVRRAESEASRLRASSGEYHSDTE